MAVSSSLGLRGSLSLLPLLFLGASYQRPPSHSSVSEAREAFAGADCRLRPELGRLTGSFEPAGRWLGMPCDPALIPEVRESFRSRIEKGSAEWGVESFLGGDFKGAAEQFEKGLESDPDNAGLHNDLAAAYLARARWPFPAAARNDERGDLLIRALKEASEALTLSAPKMGAAGGAARRRVWFAAQFNLALIYDALGWSGPAAAAWAVVVRSEPSVSAWREMALRQPWEARRKEALGVEFARRCDFLRQELAKGEDSPLAADATMRSCLRNALQEALPSALLRYVASLSRKERSSWTEIERLRRLAREVRETGGDGLAEAILREAPPAIERSGPATREAWRAALEALRDGRDHLRRRGFLRAAPELERAASLLAPLSRPLQASALVSHFEARRYASKGSEGQLEALLHDLRRFLKRTSRDEHPGLRARSLHFEGLISSLVGDSNRTHAAYGEAIDLYRRLGEPQALPVLQVNLGEFLVFNGRPAPGWSLLVEGLRGAYRFGDSTRIHNGLQSLRDAGSSQEWASLVERISALLPHEDAGPEEQAESLKLQIQDRVDADDFKEAKRLLPLAWETLKKIDEESDVRQELACGLSRLQATVDAVLAPLGGPSPLERRNLARCPDDDSPALRPDRYFRRALAARFRRGARALPDARRAVGEILSLLRGRDTASDRQALLDKHRSKIDHLVTWCFEAGRSTEALGWVIRVFEATAGRGWRGGLDGGAEMTAAALVPGERQGVLVFYTSRTSTYVWLVTRKAQERQIPAIDTHLGREAALDTLRGLEADVRKAQRPGGTGEPLARTLSKLSSELLGQVGLELAGLKRLIVVPSVELRSVPFAALTFPAAGSPGRRLVEGLELSLAVPVGSRRSGAGQAPPRKGYRSLFVANPSNAVAREAGMPRLLNAELEAKEAARLFPGSLFLSQKLATKQTTLEALLGTDLVHFATHTVHARELRSSPRLLLAVAEEGPLEDGSLGGSEIRRLNLQNLDLVNLAACRSAEPGNAAAEVEGLVEPFLEAGAGAVIATPWPLSDSLSPKLWAPFYAALLKGESPEGALRQAQLDCLKQGSNLANPAFWAGFAVYHGDLPLKGE